MHEPVFIGIFIGRLSAKKTAATIYRPGLQRQSHDRQHVTQSDYSRYIKMLVQCQSLLAKSYMIHSVAKRFLCNDSIRFMFGHVCSSISVFFVICVGTQLSEDNIARQFESRE